MISEVVIIDIPRCNRLLLNTVNKVVILCVRP